MNRRYSARKLWGPYNQLPNLRPANLRGPSDRHHNRFSSGWIGLDLRRSDNGTNVVRAAQSRRANRYRLLRDARSGVVRPCQAWASSPCASVRLRPSSNARYARFSAARMRGSVVAWPGFTRVPAARAVRISPAPSSSLYAFATDPAETRRSAASCRTGGSRVSAGSCPVRICAASCERICSTGERGDEESTLIIG